MKKHITTAALVAIALAVTACTQANEPTQTDTGYTAGQYEVGTDVPAGEHTFVSTADEDSIMGASVTVRSDSTHDMGTIITSDFFTGEYRILLEDEQYVELSQCTLLEEGK